MQVSNTFKLGKTLRSTGTALILLIIPLVNIFAVIWLIVLYIQVITISRELGRETGEQSLEKFSNMMIVVFLVGIVQAISTSLMLVNTFMAVYSELLGYMVPPSNVYTMVLGAVIISTITAIINGIVGYIAWHSMQEFFLARGTGLAQSKGKEGTGAMKAAAILGILGSLLGFLYSLIELIAGIIIAILLLVGYFTTGTAFLHMDGSTSGYGASPGYSAGYGARPQPGPAYGAGYGAGFGARSQPGQGFGAGTTSFSTRASPPATGGYVPPSNYLSPPGPTSPAPPPAARKFCTYCGSNLPSDEDVRFCPNCGASIR